MINFNLQLFADEPIKTTDIAPAISIDYTNRIAFTIKELQELFGITNLEKMYQGTQIEVYKTTVTDYNDSAAEGEIIPLSQVKRELDRKITVSIKKIRKITTVEAIARSGKDLAVNKTDEALVEETQKAVKRAFFNNMDFAGVVLTGHSAANIQAALADCWSQAEEKYEDKDISMVYFVNPQDVAVYLANANITVQEKFGFSYVENFLGLGTLVMSPRIEKGKVYGTPKENLNGAYIASGSDVSSELGLTYDATGVIGMTHTVDTKTAGIETLIVYGIQFYPELSDGIVGCEIVGA